MPPQAPAREKTGHLLLRGWCIFVLAGAIAGTSWLINTDREGIEAVMPVGPDGKFTWPVEEYAGMQVFDANPHIIDDLKATVPIWKHQVFTDGDEEWVGTP